MPVRTSAVLAGLLFLASTAAFAAGSPLLGTHVAGALLVGFTGLAVVGIAVALLPVLRPHGPRLATGYLVVRAGECLVLLAVAAFALAGRSPVEGYELLVYAFTGVAGLALSVLLLRSGLVPRWLAALGVVGYATLLLGVVAQSLGLADLGSGPGALFYVPGGLFELVLPILLLVKGFTPVDAVSGGGRR